MMYPGSLKGFVTRSVTVCVLLFCCSVVWAFNPFVVKDIKVEGLQRVSLGKVLEELRLKVGKTVSQENVTASIRALFATGEFDDVKISREDEVVVISVKERPTINKIEVTGNMQIDDVKKEVLDKIGLKEKGRFNRSTLDSVEQQLKRQYYGLSYYGVEISTVLTELPRNRVDIDIEIIEGEPGRVRKINLLGITAFDEYVLMNEFNLTQGTLWSFMTSSDKYAEEKLLADIEQLRSHYLDRGFIDFRIESKNVSISPDKKNVYITIKVNEGDQYRVANLKIAGELVVPEDVLRSTLRLNEGSVFSRNDLLKSVDNIKDRLGVDGYAFARVRHIPNVDKSKKEISLTFFVEPGKRVYVRRINITGNTKTQDEVIRRELRQMEGGWVSTPLLNRSKIRLQRLGFFDDIKISMPAVPGTTDQVDVNIEVVEGSTGNFTAGIGYGQENGFLFNTSVTLNNYLGTGKKVKLQLNNDRVDETYLFSIDDPYITKEGISRGINLSYRSRDNAEQDQGQFGTDDVNLGINFGIPVSEFTRVNFGLSGKRTDLAINGTTAPRSFVSWFANIDPDIADSDPNDPSYDEVTPEFQDTRTTRFDTLKTTFSYTYDSRNRPFFPDEGFLSQISATTSFPGADLKYYKANYRMRWYIPVVEHVSLLLGGDYGYGRGYGDGKATELLPFFEHFYAGGSRSVRGYRGSNIGPKDRDCFDDAGTTVCRLGLPIGGNERTLATLELFFPPPFTDEPSKNFRLSTFVDAGRIRIRNQPIYNNQLYYDERYRITYGFAAVWVTPVGALIFNWAWPVNEYEGDATERFQFNIGAPF